MGSLDTGLMSFNIILVVVGRQEKVKQEGH